MLILFCTAVVTFIITVIITKKEIPILKEKAGQNIREEGLESHYAKAGTPSMGGISIIIGTFVAALGASFFTGDTGNTLVILLVFVGFGIIGFIDDYRKVIRKQNEGLNAKQKFGLQMIVAIAFGVLFAMRSDHGTTVYFPGFDTYVDFGFLYVPFVVFAVLAMTNAVNLTDGLDGLASGVTAMVSATFAIGGLFFTQLVTDVGTAGPLFFAALCGGCLGFLVYNRNPARVFMGDTGSLALGGGLAAAAVVTKLELLLLIVGMLYVIEALSVVLQVGYFKLTHGKRIFRMAPIHHHFEKGGMKEVQVVRMFWAFTAACCIIGLIILF